MSVITHLLHIKQDSKTLYIWFNNFSWEKLSVHFSLAGIDQERSDLVKPRAKDTMSVTAFWPEFNIVWMIQFPLKYTSIFNIVAPYWAQMKMKESVNYNGNHKSF